MRDLFRRLGTTGGAYATGSIVQKATALALLPIYTRYLSSADYGAVEVLLQTTFTFGLLVRFGIIEAMFRFYFLEETEERRAGVVRVTGAFLVVAASGAFALLGIAADPVSEFLLGRHEPGLVRIAAGGASVMLIAEFLLALFRIEGRALPYLLAAVGNIAVTVGVSVWLVVFEELGPEGLLIGNFAGSACMSVWLTVEHRRRFTHGHMRGLLGPMLRFGGPTMSAELSLFAINVLDRVSIVRFVGLAEAGLYAVAMKLSQAVVLLSQGFNLAWAPLAYSIEDDDQAREFYARVFTYVLLVGTVTLLLTSLGAPWIVRALAGPEFYDAHNAVPLISLAVVLHMLYLTLLVAIGRVRQTRIILVAALCGLAVNVVLLLTLVPPLGMIGAAIALAACFAVVLPVLYAFVRRLFPIPFEWGRLARISLVAAVTYAIGALAVPEQGASAFFLRGLLVAGFGVGLWASGFFRSGELRRLWRPLARA